MSLAYGQIEKLIIGLLNVHDDRLPTLRARARLFRRLRFPPGVNLGIRGTFAYDADAVIAMATAFALVDARIPQELVPKLIDANWAAIKAAATAIIEAPVGKTTSRHYLAVEVSGVGHFQLSGDSDDALGNEAMTLRVTDDFELANQLRSGRSRWPIGGLTLIDFTQLVTFVLSAAGNLGMTRSEFLGQGRTEIVRAPRRPRRTRAPADDLKS